MHGTFTQRPEQLCSDGSKGWERQQWHSDSSDRAEELAERIYKLTSEMNSWEQGDNSKTCVFDMSTAMSGTPITQGRGNSEAFPRLGSREWHYHLSGGPIMDVNNMSWGHSFLFLDDCSFTLFHSDLLLRWTSPPPQSAANGKPSSSFSCIEEGWWVSGPWGIFIIAHSTATQSQHLCMRVCYSVILCHSSQINPQTIKIIVAYPLDLLIPVLTLEGDDHINNLI